jgi:hypothetical protein
MEALTRAQVRSSASVATSDANFFIDNLEGIRRPANYLAPNFLRIWEGAVRIESPYLGFRIAKLLDLAERQRVAKLPTHGKQNQLWRRVRPLEDCPSGCMLHDRFSRPANPAQVATHPLLPQS